MYNMHKIQAILKNGQYIFGKMVVWFHGKTAVFKYTKISKPFITHFHFWIKRFRYAAYRIETLP